MGRSKDAGFLFDPSSWLSDENLRACSPGARALWIDLLCLMHKNGRRGYLQMNGRPLTLDQLARATGNSTAEVSHHMRELSDSGVTSATEQGIIYSRRMVREQELRKVRSEAGKAGGRRTGRLLKQIVKQTVKQNASKTEANVKQTPAPFSSSPFSPSLSPPITPSISTPKTPPPHPPDPLPAEPAKHRRRTARDDLFDAVVEVSGLDPSTEGNGALIGKTVTALAESSPPYTPEEVRALPQAVADQGLGFALTPPAIKKFIGWVRNPPKRGKQGGFFDGIKAFAEKGGQDDQT